MTEEEDELEVLRDDDADEDGKSVKLCRSGGGGGGG